MLVRELMTTPVHHVRTTTSREAAVAMMACARVTSLPVVDTKGRVVGILSEADVLRRAAQWAPRAALQSVPQSEATTPEAIGIGRVATLMTRRPYVVAADDDVADVLTTMAAHGWKSVPVVAHERLIGIMSRGDVIRSLSRSDDEIAQEVSRVMARYGLPRWRPSVDDGTVTIRGARGETEQKLAESLVADITGVRGVHLATESSCLRSVPDPGFASMGG